MRSFSAAALFTLAIVTECLGAHSERSRQRSGPIRSVPVAADIKRDVDFDCPEEFGYYSHPTDCTLYYVCVFGGALLESCTGGLMYSHELQTCDWPRNVGCDGTSAVGAEELERISEREPPPPPPPPRRTPPPPPPPRAQPNPIITSRGQPRFSSRDREEYEKQQQLYEEVDDLPPVEEIESDRQQRVYRGQPSTIGQVQRDRDGYGSQVVSSRNFNSNIIPASIPQTNGKIGSFSFGTQVDDRRTATATQSPQSYSEDKVTDTHHDRQLDIETNQIDVNDINEQHLSRQKREVVDIIKLNETFFTNTDKIAARSDNDEAMEFTDMNTETTDYEDDEASQDDIERGKRQVRYYLQRGYKNPVKNWPNSKPIKFVDFQQFNYNPSAQNAKYQQTFNAVNQYHEGTRKPYSTDSTANPFHSYQAPNTQSERPFKASLPDNFSQRLPHAPMNIATQIITKSPPISSLKNSENLFSALAGGFYNNFQTQNLGSYQQNQNSNQYSLQNVANHPNNQVSFPDSSLLPSTVVTGKPVKIPTSPRTLSKYRANPGQNTNNNKHQKDFNKPVNNVRNQNHEHNKQPTQDEEYDDEDEDEDEDEDDDQSSEEVSDKEEGDDHYYKHDFPEPPYEFTHPSNKYANIENPFADPNFDFDDFLSKLRDDINSDVKITAPKSKAAHKQNVSVKIVSPPESTTALNSNSGLRPSTLNYNGMSTPRPFTVPLGPGDVTRPDHSYFNSPPTSEQPVKLQKLTQLSPLNQQYYGQQQQQQQNSYNENSYNSVPQQSAGVPLDAIRPKLKPPNFKDDRQLPISYSFNRPVSSTSKPNNDQSKTKGPTRQIFTITQKPYVFVTSTGTPIIPSTPKQHFTAKPDKIVSLQPHFVPTGKPYLVSSIKSHNAYIVFKQSTPKPLTTLANEQLNALQHFWRSTEHPFFNTIPSTVRPAMVSEIPKLESLFVKAIKTTVKAPVKNENIYSNIAKEAVTTTTKSPAKRRPIPKPSPEMNDYYYEDEDSQYYYEPPVKSQYMPSTEIKPQRPPMAQNYQEYEDYEDSEESSVNNKPLRTPFRQPAKYTAYKFETVTKNHNDVSVVTKAPLKNSNIYINGKIPVLVDYGTPAPNVLMRPEISNYEVHHTHRNRTVHIRKPSTNGPNTQKPPKYLNQTTLRPYTVRHRLAKPTAVNPTTVSEENKQTRGIQRHHNIVAQMKLTTPRDNYKQETRYTKTKHDDKTNSLEPTESVTPSSYSASPRPKMLYNGSQNYSPDHYDPYYAVYDEDGELYKDTDYVQQYNQASLRPAVQQTYRGTPPPARRPAETYTPRPSSQDDYDDALIHGQINNQNQYQSAIRHSTRGEGNELGYDHNPTSVKMTVYEATTISTTPSTTSTSTTTQRSTTALFTEAMTPSRYTPRSPTDENPIQIPESQSNKNPSDGSASLVPSTPSPLINFSSLAKPFEKTDNLHRLKETLTSTDRIPTLRISSRVAKNNNHQSVEVVQSTPNRENKKVVSLTTGFSFRRNPNNTNNPYTLTVLSRPFDHYNKSKQQKGFDNNQGKRVQLDITNYNIKNEQEESIEPKKNIDINTEVTSESSMRRKDADSEIVNQEEDLPIFIRPSRTKTTLKPRIKAAPTPLTTTTTKYYLKTVIKRPAPFSGNSDLDENSTENTINIEALIGSGLQNATASSFLNAQADNSDRAISESSNWDQYEESQEMWTRLPVSPYRTLSNLRNNVNKKEDLDQYNPTSTASTTIRSTINYLQPFMRENVKSDKITTLKPSYYSYHIVDEEVPDHTTEVFGGTVKNIIKALFNNFDSSPTPQGLLEEFTSISPKITTTAQAEEKVVNIGYQKKTLKYVDEKPLRNNVKRLQIVTEPSTNSFISSSVDKITFNERDNFKDFSSTINTPSSSTNVPIVYTNAETMPEMKVSFTNDEFSSNPGRKSLVSKFRNLITEKPDIEYSKKFLNIVNEELSTEQYYHENTSYNNLDHELTKTKTNFEATKTSTEMEWTRPTNKAVNEIATTTSTTKSTMTVKVEPTSTTKSLSFPTRASRVNPAIKLAATNPGGGRRSYQSPSKCSSDDSLQANPKCNEIKYQRPVSTRGRGSAHYSTLRESDTPQQQTSNRGTPPTRSRPTLKPSTAIVSKSTESVDVYAYPPARPSPVYPQPTPDKTAAKCRKDVCLLPDCSCGGKDIPGNLPVNEVPQIVLMTFDDAVNDLNKMYYEELFEKGRVNPNGCPISATFYVSHEWTDYSQVQNLYADGHEFASHTISHSFGEQFSQKKWNREVGGQREILAAYGGVKLEDVRGMRAPFLSVGGNKMFKMLYDSNFTYDSSMPVYENKPPSWPYTLDYKLFHDCMIPPCPTKSYPGVWEVPMVMWQDLNGGRCSMGDACANPPEAENVYKMLLKNFDRHYTTNRAPFGLFYHAAWFTQPHHKAGFIMFLDFINQMQDVWIVTNWQALQWVRDPTPISRLNNFQPFQCNYQDRPKKCNNPKVCNLWHKSGVRYMRTCQPCPEVYPWTGKTGIRSSRIDNDIEE